MPIFSFISNLPYAISVVYCLCPNGFSVDSCVQEAFDIGVVNLCLIALVFCSLWPESIFYDGSTVHKNSFVEVHSPAFGGRGIFFICGRKQTCVPLPAKTHKNGINCLELPSLKLQDARSPKKGIIKFSFAICFTVGIYTFVPTSFGFNQTLGFPGEGPNSWSKKAPKNITMTTWNCHSLTFERFQYCISLNHDILVLPEL